MAPLGDLLNTRLTGAKRYDRIAGYFRASLLDVAGEALETVGQVRIVCNGELDANDVAVAKAARDGGAAVAKALVSRWQAGEEKLDALLRRDRYVRLHRLLSTKRLQVRVVAQDRGGVFVHGKAGVIEAADGSTHAFIGSVNDSVNGWRHSYELLWEDSTPEAAAWVQAEFDHFWDQGVDLPDAVVRHIGALAERTDYASVEDARENLAPAVLADRPVYRAGQLLRPWQKRFVQTCLDDAAIHGKARFLLADDVGLGKTLSMAAAALVLSVKHGGPVLILAPATLTWQWQAELKDMLGIPAAVWSTTKKQWIDPDGYEASPRGEIGFAARCPYRFGIMSTGLIVNGDEAGERGLLRDMRFGVIVLDEAHKARAVRTGKEGIRTGENNLLAFMERAAANSGSVLLGTATPIQLDPVELWDLANLLQQGAPQVLGKGATDWRRDNCIDFLTGERPWPRNPEARWALLKEPLPPRAEHRVFRDIRNDAGLADSVLPGPRFDNLLMDAKAGLDENFETLAGEHNPIIRRIVRRTRPMLEAKGLLPRIAVINHPRPEDALPASLFEGEGLHMGAAFREAYDAAERFCRRYAAERPGAGFLKTILLRRIGSSPAAGLATARALLEKGEAGIAEAEMGDAEAVGGNAKSLGDDERALLRAVIECLETVVTAPDPKVEVIVTYLRDRGWLESHGAILFSQYRTTAEWVADALGEAFPGEPVALYAGGSASYVARGGVRQTVQRDEIKAAVQRGDIRLLAATDAACEGLNLQRLGAQVNVDLPWNPSRLEQRKGRVQRIGQARPEIHVVNLRYAGTVEDDVYAALSQRLGGIFAALGQLPDGFEDDWVDAVLKGRDAVRHFPTRERIDRPPMELRYARDIADDEGLDWEYTTKVIAERDLEEFLRKGW